MPAADVRHGKETRRHYAAVVLQNQNRFVMDPIKILNSSQIDHIFPVKKIKFEDIYANVPNNCDAYLTILYGDYMTPPPPNKRQAHNMIIVDVDVTRAS